jgi:hypothetical protein
VVDARVHPHEVAGGERDVDGAGGEGDAAGRRARTRRHAAGHPLEDRVDHVGRPAVQGELGQEGAGQLVPGRPGVQLRLCHPHRPLVPTLGLGDACQLVGGLGHLGRPDQRARVDHLGTVEDPRPQHGAGLLVHRDPAPAERSHDAGERAGEAGATVVQLGPNGRVRLDVQARGSAAEQVGPVRPRDDDRHRPLVRGDRRIDPAHRLPGGVADVRCVQQQRRIEALFGHRRLQPGVALPAHPCGVDRGRGQAMVGQQAAERRIRPVCLHARAPSLPPPDGPLFIPQA